MSVVKKSLTSMMSAYSTQSNVRKLKSIPESERGVWGNRIEGLLSLLGLSVGLGNLWRFPAKCFQNGGAVFFIPYIILQLLVGKPMFIMELAIGQFSGLGAGSAFVMTSGAKGVGISAAIMAFFISVYYQYIMANCIYFFLATMQKTLPWTSCRPEWLEKNCYVLAGSGISLPYCSNTTLSERCRCTKTVVAYDFNTSITRCGNTIINYLTSNYSYLLDKSKTCPDIVKCITKTRTAAEIYYFDEVTQIAGRRLTDIGSPIWFMVLCSLASWIIVLICLFKGVKTSGKVVYFTATFPYIIIVIIAIGSFTRTGSMNGIKYFLIPSWDKLVDIKAWMAAGSQMFFSLSVGMGGIITLGSYNRFNNNLYQDAIIISVMDIFTSFMAGLCVFGTLGALAHEANLPVPQVVKGGLGLAFVVYPEGLSRLPAAHLWSLLFFLMLFTLGIDSEFAMVETCITSIVDEFPQLLRYKIYVTLVVSAVSFLLMLPMTTPGGIHVLTLLDDIGCSYGLYVIALSECIAIIGFYGSRRLLQDMEVMLGHPVKFKMIFFVTWIGTCPIILISLLMASWISFDGMEYGKGDKYESWAVTIAWIIFLLLISPIFAYPVYKVYKEPGDNIKEKVMALKRTEPRWLEHKARYIKVTSTHEISLRITDNDEASTEIKQIPTTDKVGDVKITPSNVSKGSAKNFSIKESKPENLNQQPSNKSVTVADDNEGQ